MTPTLSLCKMCARLADYQTRTHVHLCNECRDYMLKMGDVDRVAKSIKNGRVVPMPPWERMELVRSQEFIEAELAEPIP